MSTATFALHFSGSDVFEQQRRMRSLLSSVPETDHDERARLYAINAAAVVFTDGAAAREAAIEAQNAAARARSKAAEAWALVANSVVDLSCESTKKRLEMTGRALEIARETGETEFVPVAYFLHVAALAELGKIDELDRALSPLGPYLADFPWLETGRHVAWFRCLQATRDGQVETAERLANEAYLLAQTSGDPDAQSVYVGQLAIIRWTQGRAQELEPAFLQARLAAPHEPIWAVCLAWVWLKQGRKSAARALVSSLPPIEQLPVDRNWLSTTCILADVASELGQLGIVEQLHGQMLPFEDRLVTIGLGVTCWGTVARPLAVTARAMGDIDAAILYYRKAIEVAARCGAHPWLAESQIELAQILAERAQDGDREEAFTLASEAVATGRALRLHGTETAAAAVLASMRTDEPEPTESAEQSKAEKPCIRVLDDFSVTSADGEVAHWQSRKARQLLKILIGRRGATVSRETLMDLLWPGESPDLLANRFSVATTAVRRALDPNASAPRDAYLESRDGLLRLRTETIDIDVERFFALVNEATQAVGDPHTQKRLLTDALSLYVGEPMREEQEEAWASELRREAHFAYFTAAHTLADLLETPGNEAQRLSLYRRILNLDEYDQRAHEGLIETLETMGSHGQAEEARSEYVARMEALGVL